MNSEEKNVLQRIFCYIIINSLSLYVRNLFNVKVYIHQKSDLTSKNELTSPFLGRFHYELIFPRSQLSFL